MPLALSQDQLRQVTETAHAVPYTLRAEYLQRVSELLAGRDFGDGDVHRAVIAAARQVLALGRKAS